MPSAEFGVILETLRDRPKRSSDDVAVWRADMVERTAAMRPAEDCSFEAVDAGGVPAEWVTPANAEDRTLVYFHGGGYAIGSVETHRGLASNLGTAARARVLNVDYRLGPEHPFPAAVEDGLAAFRWLVSQGVSPERTAMGGDSAGGGLTLATMLSLRDAGEALPGAAVLLCPWTDLTMSGDSIATMADQELIARVEDLETLAEWYLNGHDAADPLVSQVFADLSGLPPMLVHVGGGDVLIDDGRRVAQNALAAGVDATLEEWDEMIHVWHAMAPILPEGKEANDRIGEYLRDQIR